LPEQARHDVGSTAGGETDDNAYRLRPATIHVSSRSITKNILR
jgi:hypothetical protein